MKVLLNMLFAVHLHKRRLCVDMITIVEAVMLHIVTESSHQEGKSVHVLKVSLLDHSLTFEYQVTVLSHI